MSKRTSIGRTRRDRSDQDRGNTIVELMVTLAVMTIAAGVIGTVLVSAQQVTNRMQRSAAAVDDARLITATIDRELRSASCIGAPGENLSGNTLTFRTVAYGATVLVTYTVGNGVVTRSEGLNSPGRTVIGSVGMTTAAFHQVTSPLRTVLVDIPIKSANGGEFHLRTTIAGRNAWRAC